MLKVASWNVNSLRVRLPHVLDWLTTAKPDLLGLQETKTVDKDFPLKEIADVGYQVIFSGQKTYNGVAVLSRLDAAAADIVTDIPDLEDPQRRVLAATYGDLRFINLYVPNGAEVGSDKYAYKLNWLEKLIANIKQQQRSYEKIIIVGDFNIAPEDRDVHDPTAWEGMVLVSEPERKALQDLLKLGFKDTFRLFEQEERIFSWWDYRAVAFRRNHGLRIDLILSSEEMSQRCITSSVDKEPRRWERPSDHAPVCAEFS